MTQSGDSRAAFELHEVRIIVGSRSPSGAVRASVSGKTAGTEAVEVQQSSALKPALDALAQVAVTRLN